MSITDSFDADRGIIEPREAVEIPADFPDTLLACFTEKFVAAITEKTGAEQFDHAFAGRGIPILRFSRGGRTVGFYQSPVGGAASAAILEEAIAKGAKKVLFFGSCGSLDAAHTAGKLLIPTAAYRDEGASYHYLPAGNYIAIGTADRLAAIFDRMNVPYLKTKTWTTDAFYRETQRNMLSRKEEGCAAVEMECASVMAVGKFRGVEVYQFLYTADCLDGEGWDRRILGGMPEDLRDAIAEIAVETAIRL
ncbi:MAG: nucleoside phosphorylase [Clostridia bacterium]|nr:nucleoside phosphorylase [Clostridia bacterium]